MDKKTLIEVKSREFRQAENDYYDLVAIATATIIGELAKIKAAANKLIKIGTEIIELATPHE